MEAEREHAAGRIDRIRFWLWIIVIALTVLMGLQLISTKLTFLRGGDSTVYVLLSRSIAEGHGFSDLNIPMHPAHTRYPPLLPLILSPVFYFLRYNFAWMHFIIIALGCLAVYMTKKVFETGNDRILGVITALLLTTNLYLTFFLREILTEMPYMFLSLLALYLIERAISKEWKISYTLAAAAVVAAAILTRTIGVTLYAAALIVIITGAIKQGSIRAYPLKRIALFAVAAILPLILWNLRGALFAEGVDTYTSIFLTADNYAVDSGPFGLAALLTRTGANLLLYTRALPRTLLIHLDYGRINTLLFNGICLITLLTILGGLAVTLYRRRGLREFYLLFYLMVLAVWPVYGTGDAVRYIVPIIPFLYYYLFAGVGIAAGLLGGPASTPPMRFSKIMVLTFLILLTHNLLDTAKTFSPRNTPERIRASMTLMRQNLFKRYDHVQAGDVKAKRFDRRSPCFNLYIDSAYLVKEASGPDSIIAARKPELVTLISERYSLLFPFSPDSEKMLQFFEEQKIDYVIVDDCYEETRKYLKPFIKDHTGRFETVKKGYPLLRFKR